MAIERRNSITKKIRVGIIGARADRGWAGAAHVPAVKAVDELDLFALATTKDNTANAAAAAFGVPLAFGDPFELIRHPDVDIVSVVVKAPEHRALVLAAIEAGKSVFCEWPLGVRLDETEELAKAASRHNVRTAIGLQGRLSPWLNHVRALVHEGYVGRILSTILFAADDFSTGKVSQGNAYMLNLANGANPLTIHGGHFIDSLCHVVGELAVVTAQLATTLPEVVVQETGESIRSTSPDQVAVAGTLSGGGVASIHIRAGRSPGDTVFWEIQGTHGILRITSENGFMHWDPLKIEGALAGADRFEVVETPKDFFDPDLKLSDGPHRNVSYAYAAFARDLIHGTRTVADFTDALARHRTIDAIARAATDGQILPVEPEAHAETRTLGQQL